MNILSNIIWFLLGKKGGASTVILEDGEDYDFTDENNDGHIVITKKGE